MVVEVGTCEEEAMTVEVTIDTTGHPTLRPVEEATVAGTVADLGVTRPTSKMIQSIADGSCLPIIGRQTEHWQKSCEDLSLGCWTGERIGLTSGKSSE